jgi:hypothetical protein
MIVESSPGKYHRYILVDGAPLDEFEPVQQRLVDDFGSDPNAKDRSRVLRLPGFFHRKVSAKKHLIGQAHLVRVIHQSWQPPLSWSDVVAVVKPVDLTAAANNAPMPGPGYLPNPAEIASALLSIDPDIPFNKWLTVLMGVHHASGGGKDGRDLVEEWSKRGALYKPGEVAYRWSTFGRYPGRSTTIKSVYRLAHDSGWSDKYVMDDTVVQHIQDEHNRKLKAFSDKHALVMVKGKAVIAYREPDGKGRIETLFSTPESMSLKVANQRLPYIDDSKDVPVIKEKPLFATWKTSSTRQTFERATYEPVPGLIAGSLDLLPAPSNYRALNLYQGLTIAPQPGSCQLILSHLFEVWCNQNVDHYWYLVRWLSYMFRNLAEQGHTVIVAKSGEGAGKGVIIDMLARIFGVHQAILSNPDRLTGRFNSRVATSSLVVLNEAIWGGDKKAEGTLKTLITDDTLEMEQKHIEAFSVPNYTHLMVSSNNDWVIPVGLDDRRFFVLDLSEERKGDFPYFDALLHEIHNGGEAAFLYYLMFQVSLDSFHPREMPQQTSATRIDNKVRTADTITQWWIECLDEGEITYTPPDSSLVRNAVVDWDDRAQQVIRKDLYTSYEQFCNRRKKHIESSLSLRNNLKRLLGGRVEQLRPRLPNGARPRCLNIPSLKDCREEFYKLTGDAPWGINDD